MVQNASWFTHLYKMIYFFYQLYLFFMAHIHELIDWTAGVYIVHNNKVLIRLHDKVKLWIHVGGHVELDEDPVTAAIRECKEEVGLDITIYDSRTTFPTSQENVRHLIPPAHMNIHYVSGNTTHQHIDCIYYATSTTDTVVPEKDDDVWLWLSREELEQFEDIQPYIKEYALGALQTLKT